MPNFIHWKQVRKQTTVLQFIPRQLHFHGVSANFSNKHYVFQMSEDVIVIQCSTTETIPLFSWFCIDFVDFALFSILGTIERCNNNTKCNHNGNQCGDHSSESYQTIMSTYEIVFRGLVPMEYEDIYLNIYSGHTAKPRFCLWMNENGIMFQSEFLN